MVQTGMVGRGLDWRRGRNVVGSPVGPGVEKWAELSSTVYSATHSSGSHLLQQHSR